MRIELTVSHETFPFVDITNTHHLPSRQRVLNRSIIEQLDRNKEKIKKGGISHGINPHLYYIQSLLINQPLNLI
nr:MAG TPA: hypothetical protein [Caudoviricetes sp.]